MTTASPTDPTAPPPGSVVIGSARHATLASYPPVLGMRLHSLATPAVFTCQHCGQQRETALAATTGQHTICPGCFAHLARAGTPPTP